MTEDDYRQVDRRDLIDLVLSIEYGHTDYYFSDMQITVLVSGTTWTGELVPYPHFLDAQADYLASVTVSPEDASKLVDLRVESLRRSAERVRELIRSDAAETPSRDEDRAFIHLRNARQSGEWTVYPAMRFKLAAVDAWTLGIGQQED